MICLYLQAKFAAFRPFTTGSFRPTAGFISHSAAYGLLLNIAGIDMRYDDGKSEMTLIRNDLPLLEIAMGTPYLPGRQSIYQQLHNYPIGTTGKENAPRTKGNKYNIFPARREILTDVKAYVFVKGNPEFESRIQDGLQGKWNNSRYGVLFLGDNNFLLDKCEIVQISQVPPICWLEKISQDTDTSNGNLNMDVTRLTISIDRQNMTNSKSDLFVLSKIKTKDIPDKAWVTVGYSKS